MNAPNECSLCHSQKKMAALEGPDIWGNEDPLASMETDSMTNEELRQRRTMIENEVRIFQGEERRINFEKRTQQQAIKENKEKIKLNKALPWLIANVVEV
jgi:26S proteasome regulatory subunit T5